LTNSGTIAHDGKRINNRAGFIGSLTNIGTISGNSGIVNSGSIGTLSNSGTIQV